MVTGSRVILRLGGAGLTLAEAPEADKPRLRSDWRYLIRQTITAMRIR